MPSLSRFETEVATRCGKSGGGRRRIGDGLVPPELFILRRT